MSSHRAGHEVARLSTGAPVPLDTPIRKDYTHKIPEKVVFIDLSKTVRHPIFQEIVL